MPMYLVWLLAQRSPLLHWTPTNQRLSWRVRNRTTGLPRLRNAGAYRLLRSHFRMTCYPSTGRTSPSAPLPNRVTCARLNIPRGPTTSKLIQNKQLEFWKLFKVFSQVKRRAESKKAAILFELPKGCEYWNDERLKKQIKNGESHEFDGCRYSLKQGYAKKPLPIRKPWRVISWNFWTWGNPFLRSAVATTVMDLVLVGKPRPSCQCYSAPFCCSRQMFATSWSEPGFTLHIQRLR